MVKITQYGKMKQSAPSQESSSPNSNAKAVSREMEMSRCHRILKAMQRVPEAELPAFIQPAFESSSEPDSENEFDL